MKADPTDWLLEEENPSVRYFTLTKILDKPETNLEVKKARDEIMITGVVPKVLVKQKKGGYCEGVLPCSTGNMVWSLIRFGYLEDPRVQRGINWIIRYQRFDDGIKEALKGWPYDRQGHPHCWGYTRTRHVHTYHMGVIKALKTLSEIPVNKRSKEVVKTVEEGLSTCLSIIFTREVVI